MTQLPAFVSFRTFALALLAVLGLFVQPAAERSSDPLPVAGVLDEGVPPATADAPKAPHSRRATLRGWSIVQLRLSSVRREFGPVDRDPGAIAASSASARIHSALHYIAHLTMVECGSLSSRGTSLPPPPIA
jgi:hypothetical protein